MSGTVGSSNISWSSIASIYNRSSTNFALTACYSESSGLPSSGQIAASDFAGEKGPDPKTIGIGYQTDKGNSWGYHSGSSYPGSMSPATIGAYGCYLWFTNNSNNTNQIFATSGPNNQYYFWGAYVTKTSGTVFEYCSSASFTWSSSYAQWSWSTTDWWTTYGTKACQVRW